MTDDKKKLSGYLEIADGIAEGVLKLREEHQEKAEPSYDYIRVKLARGEVLTEKRQSKKASHEMEVDSAESVIKPWDLCGNEEIGARYGKKPRTVQRWKKTDLPGLGPFPFDSWKKFDWSCCNSSDPWVDAYYRLRDKKWPDNTKKKGQS